MDHVFVYGTLKRGEPNHLLLSDENEGIAIFVGKARTVSKWPLVIASLYNIPYLLHQEGQGHNVIGEIYQVDAKKIAAMDRLEGHPEYYVREEAIVELLDSSQNNESQIMKCWIYFLKDFKARLLELPFLEDYSSEGPHNLPYVTSEDLNDPSEI